MSEKKHIIIGGSGVVGSALRRALRSQQTIATYRTALIDGGVRFNAGADDFRTKFPNLNQFDVAHILLVSGSIDQCARDPIGTGNINVTAVKVIIQACWDANVLPVFTSTDAVFDGTQAPYGRHDKLSPILTYGRQKAEVETWLAGQRNPYLVARLSKVLSTRSPGSGLIVDWLAQIKAGAEIRCAVDQQFSPILDDDAAKAIIGLVDNGCNGLYNVAGTQRCKRIDLLRWLADQVDADQSVSAIIRECSIHDFPFAERRPLDTSLNVSETFDMLGWTPRTPQFVMQNWSDI